jgi:ubiquinone/menaquinone biosynthesis C-methylase UbiE
MNKSSKELAYLYDLYVAPDWGERFAKLFDEHLKLPKQARALYIGAGTGGHALALKERGGEEFEIISIDENSERTELARAKAQTLKAGAAAEFHTAQIETLPFEDASFDFVIGDASLIAAERLPEMIAEMARVAKANATVALSAATSSSFGEFFSIYWEALAGAQIAGQELTVENFITELPNASDIKAIFAREDLNAMQSWTKKEEFEFENGEEFLSAPLVENFLLERWLEPLPDAAARETVTREIARIINDERGTGGFNFSIKATLVVGRKGAD